MSNIGKIEIKNSDWQDINTLLPAPLTEGLIYTIQIFNSVYLCPKESMPKDNEGFYLNDLKALYKYKLKPKEKLYVKMATGIAYINICQ